MNPLWAGFIPLDAVGLTESRLLDALNVVFIQSSRSSPSVVLCGVRQAAAIQAHVDFQGRDRRRIKREVNKAMRRARRELSQ